MSADFLISLGLTKGGLTVTEPERTVLNGLQPGQDKAPVQALPTQSSQILSDRESQCAWPRSHRTSVLKVGQRSLVLGNAGAAKFGAQLVRGIARGLKP